MPDTGPHAVPSARVRALVTTEWLADHLRDPDLRVVDVRWSLDPSRRGRDAYALGHIPGAVFLDVDADLSGPGGGRGRPRGRHPWPPPEQVARVMGAAGIGPGVRVVAYDDQAGATAARLWYVLRAHGHDAVAVLDGGLAKWLAEGRPLDTSVPSPAPAVFGPRLRPGWVVTKPQVVGRAEGTLVLDARAAERYRGETEPIDLRAGHIPGARHAPYSGNLTTGPVPVFRPAAELRARYAALGAGRAEPIVYCGSGVTACHDLLALEVAGLGGRLYAGSWSEWSADPDLPVATGAEP
ncbi:MAG TPA: sulfurtransferase [Vicinamibacteria bacterium]|nr:sulfurtransferase [Vicinamibacteria bacterium]